jgi:adenylate kinase
LEIVGDGRNIIPTIHVKDLATMVTVIAQTPAKLNGNQYVVAVDNGNVSQADIVTAISKGLGNGAVQRVPAMDENVLLNLESTAEMLTTDMKFEQEGSFLSTLDGMTWTCQEGFLEKIALVQKEFVTSRKLSPMKVFLHGPPGAGKTHYGKILAEKYYLPHINIKDAIEEVLNGPPSQLKDKIIKSMDELNNQMKTQKKKKTVKKTKKKKGGKEEDERPRVPQDLVTIIMRQKLSSAPCRNKGYVLDGYPRTLDEAKELFHALPGEAPAGGAEPEPEEAAPVAAEGEGKEGEEGAPAEKKLPAYAPEFVVTLMCREETGARRNRDMHADIFVDGHNDEDNFKRRWQRYTEVARAQMCTHITTH